jgi:hypothetical protein
VDPMIRRWEIERVKARIKLCHSQGIALAKEFEASTTDEEKADIVQRWDRAVKEELSLKIELEMLGRQEGEPATQ